ncbi:MAG: imidazole glycerol phosphate synthase subunit HisF [Saprospiraceae bacterium]|jgi:cyclase
MLAKRIIPCLDIKDGRTVKGINFEGLRDAGDPIELGHRYSEEGADELVFLDITATHEKRKTMSELAHAIASNISIPFTIGGGISSLEDASVVLNAGADKISINSAAVRHPSLINELAQEFGSQFVVVAIDARLEENKWMVYLNGGRLQTDYLLKEWVLEVADRGAGEILFTSMNHDGTKEGFADEMTAWISTHVPIPVIASGGAGTEQHFLSVFQNGLADAALAASVFHYKEIEILRLKQYLSNSGISVRQ